MLKRFIQVTLLFFILQIVFICLYGTLSFCKRYESDVLVVFGNTVYPDGSLSPLLKSRVERAYKAWRAMCAPNILVSGGVGKEGFPEGTAMANYLIEKGVPESVIFTDNLGINSHATSQHTKEILNEHGWKKVTVVTTYYHVLRAKISMQQVGIKNVSGIGSYSLHLRDIVKIPRELVALYVYLLKY